MSDILTSPRGQRMLTYVAPIYDDGETAKAIFQANGIEMDELRQWITEIRDQRFPQRATWGLKIWEFVLGIPTDESLPLAVRRQAVLSKMVMRVPITPAKIKEIAQQSTGKTASVENKSSANTFRVTIDSDGTGVDLVKLNDRMNIAKPAHLTVEYGIRYQAGVTINAERTVHVQSPLVCVSDTFLCGIYPKPAQLFESTDYQATAAIGAQVTNIIDDFTMTGTFNCGEGYS